MQIATNKLTIEYLQFSYSFLSKGSLFKNNEQKTTDFRMLVV